MKKLILLFCLACVIAFYSSCKKAGTGGDATLVVFLQHHGTNIINHAGYPDTVFIKFNSQELPGTSPADFDAYFIGETGEDHVHCEGLKKGDYYIYGTGYDSLDMHRVKGGYNIRIGFSERKEEKDINLAVYQ